MKKRTVALFLAAAALLAVFSSCKKEEEKTAEKHIYESVVDGKLFSVSYVPEKEGAESTVEYSAEEIDSIDKNAEAALVARLSFLSAEYNGNIGNINAYVDYVFDYDAELAALMTKLYEISDATGGSYMPVILSGEAYKCSEVIEIGEDRLVKHDRNAKIDLYGVSESYALGFAAESVKEAGIKEAVLKYGNTVARIDEKSEKTPIEAELYYADGNSDADSKVKLYSGYLSTYTKNDKLTDPVTGNDVTHRHNTVVVMSENSLIASCLAETFMKMDTDAVLELYGSGAYEFEFIIVEDDMTVTVSAGAKEKGLFTSLPEEEQ